VVVHADGNSIEGRLLGLDEHGRLVIEPLSETITGDGSARQDGRISFIGGTLRYIQ
jgi:small nuclear ribonucleoprotein (snRNP)-like protein